MNLSSFFSKQAQKPSGLFGRFVMAAIFDIGNAYLNGMVNNTLAIKKDDYVLDIGCGTGKLIQNMAKKISSILKPGGQLFLAFEDIQQLQQGDLDHDVFHFYTIEKAEDLLYRSGFTEIEAISKANGKLKFHCVVAKK